MGALLCQPAKRKANKDLDSAWLQRCGVLPGHSCHIVIFDMIQNGHVKANARVG